MWNKIQRIYVGQDQVRPAGWKPWTNTLLYVSMKDAIAVDAGTYTFTNTSVTNTTLSWVKCGYFNWSARLDTTLPWFSSQQHTISVWYKSWTVNAYWIICSNPCGRTYWEVIYCNSSTDIRYNTYTWSSTPATISYNTTVTNRNHYLYTWWAFYVNWVKAWTTSTWCSAYWNFCIWWHNASSSCTRRFCTGYMREVILEDKVWSEDEVVAYFNQTKWEFWL